MSYVRCQRCGRPVCADCQRPAPVGVQCPDCVAEAAAAVPAKRTTLGGQLRQGPPVVTLTFVGLCVASYVIGLVNPAWVDELAFNPLLGQAEPYRFLTAAFLHASTIHIASNLIALWFIGPYLEQALGRARFATLYLLSAVGGQVGVVLLAGPTHSWSTWVVGASGAVFGLFGAIFFVMRRLGGNASGIIGVIVLNVVIGFVVPGIAWQAHAGGLVVGALLGAAYAFAPPARRRLVAVAAPVALVVVMVVAVKLVYASVNIVFL
ncbi:rhomboid family intramembrane serine protease [Cellulomonas sp. PhB150]|uniref:rhomboid family intramembrane serine protease n=1 Tax=Cellulomonas sp. PhB150 TaxID=2485188 RepID=UPI001F349E7B|nr:rhomboid family intramembrane serine protease [Cellulomonas sp. PhB150]